MPDTDSEEEIPEAEELAEELTEGILSEPETEAVSAETPVEPESAASIQAPSQPDMRAQMQQQTQQAEPAAQQEATAAVPIAAENRSTGWGNPCGGRNRGGAALQEKRETFL